MRQSNNNWEQAHTKIPPSQINSTPTSKQCHYRKSAALKVEGLDVDVKQQKYDQAKVDKNLPESPPWKAQDPTQIKVSVNSILDQEKQPPHTPTVTTFFRKKSTEVNFQ